MFTGIIEITGHIDQKNTTSNNINLSIIPDKKEFMDDIKHGASIAVNGVCLTVTDLKKISFNTFVSSETYQITNLRDIHSKDHINLEKALKINDRIDGHIVMGHVDNTGTVTGIYKINQDYKLSIKVTPSLLKYIIVKGSIAVNGISLTVAEIKSDILSFSIIPETYNNTNIPYLKTGNKINVEVDMFAKYIEKLSNPSY